MRASSACWWGKPPSDQRRLAAGVACATMLDRDLPWEQIEAIAEDAYAEVAPARLVEARRG